MRISSWIGAGIVAGTLTVLPGAASAGGWWHNQDVVEIRVGPGVSYAKLVLVPKHKRIRIYGCSGWCDVSWGTYRGYVQTKYIVNLGSLADPANVTPKHHLPYVTPVFADHLYVSPVAGRGDGYLTPVYVPPAPAYLTSQVLGTWDGYGVRPVGRIWYYQGRWLDRPDYAYDVRH